MLGEGEEECAERYTDTEQESATGDVLGKVEEEWPDVYLNEQRGGRSKLKYNRTGVTGAAARVWRKGLQRRKERCRSTRRRRRRGMECRCASIKGVGIPGPTEKGGRPKW